MSTAVPNHRRTKPGGIKPGAAFSGVTGPTSQIPGLSQTADESTPVERLSGRRVGIFATDSDYVKLAKQGGHKGLLSHDDDADDKPKKAYNPPNWFGGDGPRRSKASSPDSEMKAGRQPLAAPFGTDNGSSWEREADSFSHGKEKSGSVKTTQGKCILIPSEESPVKPIKQKMPKMSPDGAVEHMEGLSLTNKYKRTSYEKKAPPVSMSMLLSHGYMEDKKKSPNDDDTSSVTSERTSTVLTEDVDDLE